MASCARRTVQLEEDDLPYRKGSNATIRSEGTGTEYYAKHGMLPTYDSTETVRASRPISTASTSSMRVRRLSSLTDDNTRFPKLQDCAHFHYDTVDINTLQVCLSEDDNDLYHHNGESQTNQYFFIKISSNDKTWLVRRNLHNFRMLDQKLHRCIFDRKFSHLPDLALLNHEEIGFMQLREILGDYLLRFSTLAGSMLNCGSVLNWLEIDNRGNRILAVDDSGINTPAIAAAHAIKRYTAQAADEISLEVGDIVSVIDMPPTDDTIWWRGKRGFEVGFFPYECVEVIGDKVPASMVTGIPETPANRALLKKHGKFISFLRLFFNNRPARIQLKQSGIVKERVFGCDLGEHLLNSGHDVPLVLKSCADVIETHGLVDGIYRLSGITSNIQKLRLAFDEDRVPDLTSEEYLQDVHSISSLLKMYFRELPNPLLTYQLYDKFADAVRDEENKLLRIHDVVQQLPPPHYRTTEYLMRHLSRVAAHGHETGMHSKNLAIVWAPNLLRSKELETGGGAAALRGVGIQAVVTEFLILYAELIFSDKMPSYSSPELKKSQRKPRPKSLAISTPTRLLSLEEARERALLGNIVKSDQKYIDVGGGPTSLPAKYHTVIDLPGYKKKGSKDSGGGKVKKSPGGGLKSLFSRSRSGSIRQKGRKPSIHESLNFEPGERKAITEEDVQHWKRRRIRSAKSAESLLSLPVTSRLGSPLTESLDPHKLMNILAGNDSSPTKFTRSLSIESPRHLASSQEHSISYPSFILEDDGAGREMAIDVNPEDIQLDFSEHSDREKSESPEDGIRRNQSFVRNETKRRVICHRRTPSAPTTPRHDRHEVGSSCRDVDDALQQQFSDHHKDRSVSQPMLEGALSSKPPRGAGKYITRHDSENSERFYGDSFVSDSQIGFSRNSDESGSEKRKGSKTPPKDRKKLKDGKEKSPFGDGKVVRGSQKDRNRHGSGKENILNVTQKSESDLITVLPESPGSKRKLWTNSTSASEEQAVKTAQYFYSRHHDYAEIDDNDVVDSANSESRVTNDRSRNSLNKSDSAISTSPDGSRRYRVESIDNIREYGVESQSSIDSQSEHLLETDFPASSMNRGKIGSLVSSSGNIHGANGSTADSNKKYKVGDDLLTEISNLEHGIQSIQRQQSVGNQSMSKCMSIPSDIQKSLENIQNAGDSHSLMSSVTISELSVSQDNVFANDMMNTERRRRSTSLDGLNDESPLSRTLREINAQIDQAFKHDKHRAQSLRDLQTKSPCSPCTPKGYESEIDSELISYSDELAITPTGCQRSFGSMRDVVLESPSATGESSFSFDHNKKHETMVQQNQNKFVDRPAAEIHIVDAPRVIRAPLRPNKGGDAGVTSPARTVPTPTRPSPPASLDIVPTTTADHQKSVSVLKDVRPSSGIQTVKTQNQTPTKEQPTHNPYANVNIPPITDYRITEEDFQKFLMSDPDSMRQFEQSMMYSPVRSRSKGSFFDSDRSNRSSMMSPVEGVVPRVRSNRSSLASPEASPGSFSRHPHNRSFGSPEASPQSVRQQHNQSFSSSEASPQTGMRQKHSQSYSSSEASPQSTRQKHNQSFSSSEASPQTGARHKHNQSFSSAEASPQTGSRHKHGYGAASPQLEGKRYGQSPKSDKKNLDSPHHDKRVFMQQSPKIEQRKSSSTVSSPLSPEHKQPRWEDLAGLNDLNDSFNELDLAVFNENWKKCLAPTGDSVRLSNTVSDSNEHLSNQNEFPEVSTGTDTVVLERPSIRRKTGTETAAAVTGDVKRGGKSKVSEIETYDNVPEHESYMLPHETRTDNRTIITERPSMTRSNTLPAESSLPQSPTFRGRMSGGAFLEHSSSFESSSSSITGLVREVSFESSSATNSSSTLVDRPSIRKSNTTPALTRQKSFDSSYRSVRVTSMGSSLDEPDVGSPEILPSLVHEQSRSSKSSSDYSSKAGVVKSSSASKSAFSMTSHHSNQSSVLIRSESSQSADFSYPDISQSNRLEQNSNQSNVGNLLPQMLEEMDVNESCLGIASHQNLSNEMKEMMQEQLKEHAGVLSPLDEVIAPFSGVTSPLSQPGSFFDTNHPLAGFDMESSIEIPSDVRSVDLPEMNLQFLCEGPTLIATPTVLSQLDVSDSPHVHQPIDNTEEEFQNAVNDDLERNLASLTEYLPQHVSVCEPPEKFRDENAQNDSYCQQTRCGMMDGQNPAAGLEHMMLISPTCSAVTETPEPITQDSVSSSSSSSQIDSMSSSFTYPQSFDSKHYYSPRVNSLNIQGDLAPPPLEMIEICKSTLVRSKPPSGKKTTQKGVKWEYPKILTDSSKGDRKSTDKVQTDVQKSNISSERGEEKLLMDNRPSLKKGGNVEAKLKVQSRQLTDIVDSDQGENSGVEDEVFMDPSEVTPSTNYFAAGSKYFKRRDFLSYGHFPNTEQNNISDNASSLDSKRFNFDNSSRCSLDESMMQMVTNRHDDLVSGDSDPLSNYHDDLITMDIGHENAEDIRFSKAHRSSKLLSLCEKFETGSGQSLNSEDGETDTENKKTITPPEKNIVLSIRQMHESLEVDKPDKEKNESISKIPQKVTKGSVDENLSREEMKNCVSPTTVTAKDSSYSVDIASTSQKSPTAAPQGKEKEFPKAQGKPPKYRGKNRTPSESSLSENEGVKGSPKNSKLDGSPRSRYENSPKRLSLVSSDEGSPKLLPSGGSPKGQRYSTEISPKLPRGKDGPLVVPHSGELPKLQKSPSASKIPVKLVNLPKDDKKLDNDNAYQSSVRYGNSPKNLRNSVPTGSDSSPKSASKGDKSEKEIKSHRNRRGESVEERYNLNFERQSPTRVHFEEGSVKTRVTDSKNAEEKKKRRGSIKELTNVFEEKIETISKQVATNQSPPQSKLRSRVRSVSPTTAANKSPTMPTNIRHSVELTSLANSDGVFKNMEGNLKQPTVRIGPKPFYGAKQ